MNKKLIVLGCGSQAKYVIETIKYLKNKHKSFIINDVILADIEGEKYLGSNIEGFEVSLNLETAMQLITLPNYEVIIAHGNNYLKEKIIKKIKHNGVNFFSIIHPKTQISYSSIIGRGTIINPGVVLSPDVVIGEHCIVHSGSIIEHDCKFSDFVNIAPGAILTGNVKVGKRTYIYSGAKIIPGINIGEDVVIGAGSVVISDVPDKTKIAGVPAKIINY